MKGRLEFFGPGFLSVLFVINFFAGNSVFAGNRVENFFSLTPEKNVSADTIYSYDFEAGWDNWWADNGVWEVGIPTVGPPNVHSGQNCAGTILGGNYPNWANSSLISPWIALPSLSPGERLQLKFWHWFLIESSWDKGFIQIKVSGGDWQTIAGPITGASPVWTQVCIDLSAYADSTVRIAFYFTSDGIGQDNGWYVDDVAIIKGPIVFNNPEDFETGVGDWSADNGLWEVGIPTVGPDTVPSGQNCAGTILGGNYPNWANTRLISPEVSLCVNAELCFLHWFRIEGSWDNGYVQIKVNGSDWQTIAGPITGISPVWTQRCVDLSAYADSTVRIAFYFTSDGIGRDEGWYVDDIRINGMDTVTCGDINDDWRISVSDVVYLINYLFKSGPSPQCSEPYLDCGDANGDGKISISDCVYLINYLFKGGPAPAC